MPTYHLRRSEKAITDEGELLEVIDGQQHLTLALCHEGRPYLVTVNYGYAPEERAFYFHCAGEGRKIDYLRAHPRVYGQILEDRGYVDAECDHAFRTVNFSGTCTFLVEREAKREALHLMIRHLESDPQTVMARFSANSFARVTVGRIAVEKMTGKRNIPK
jgi:hypothetical protein